MVLHKSQPPSSATSISPAFQATLHNDSTVKIRPRGKGWRLSCVQWVGGSPEEVFPFFASPRNLERLTPPFLQFNIRRVTSDPIRTGTILDYTLQFHHVPVFWRTRIDEWEPPFAFVDRQQLGPFRRWHHRHDFTENRNGTIIRDTVTYELYLGPLGRGPLFGWVHGDLKKIFAYRQEQVRAVFESMGFGG